MTADEAAARVRDVADRLYAALYADESPAAAPAAEHSMQRAAEGTIARLIEAEEQFTFAAGPASLAAGLAKVHDAREILGSFLATSAERETQLVQVPADAFQALDELLAAGQALRRAA